MQSTCIHYDNRPTIDKLLGKNQSRCMSQLDDSSMRARVRMDNSPNLELRNCLYPSAWKQSGHQRESPDHRGQFYRRGFSYHGAILNRSLPNQQLPTLDDADV
ncbi:uncharacterized protein LOC134270979 isoform X2 [Saccostrea cucullata]|uniref:uncharacterized protein LOC134270979 isoform X2 n=1 Tax=Saccostrea cuccullata TaxID=36930 RepID=UPI002ED2662E